MVGLYVPLNLSVVGVEPTREEGNNGIFLPIRNKVLPVENLRKNVVFPINACSSSHYNIRIFLFYTH